MRIAVLILGLILGAVMAVQSFLVAGLSGFAKNPKAGEAGVIGLLMALLWLVGSALVVAVPVLSIVLFSVAGLLGFLFSSAFPDLGVWAAASFALTALSGVALRNKQKEDAQKQADRENQRLIAERLAAMERAVGTWPADRR